MFWGVIFILFFKNFLRYFKRHELTARVPLNDKNFDKI